jgi:hypothetical protein
MSLLERIQGAYHRVSGSLAVVQVLAEDGQLDEAKRFVAAALTATAEIQDLQRRTSRRLWVASCVADMLRDEDLAATLLQESLDDVRSTQADALERGNAMADIAEAHVGLGQLERGLETVQQIESPDALAFACSDVALWLARSNRHDEALRFAVRARPAWREILALRWIGEEASGEVVGNWKSGIPSNLTLDYQKCAILVWWS